MTKDRNMAGKDSTADVGTYASAEETDQVANLYQASFMPERKMGYLQKYVETPSDGKKKHYSF